jgi:hypothetical protein
MVAGMQMMMKEVVILDLTERTERLKKCRMWGIQGDI